MRIVRCTKCKKYLHKAAACFHCGNTTGFEDIEVSTVHENAIEAYSKVESLVENQKFNEALELSHIVIEWMPNLADIFWLRLLAKNRCSNAATLIQKGFNCTEDPDFCNALTFSKSAERSAYEDVQSMVLAVQKALKTEILNHEYNCKMRTNILQIKKTMNGIVETHQKNLFSLWAELEETEKSMCILEKDCIMLAKEHSNDLEIAAKSASLIVSETRQLTRCNTECFHRLQVRMSHIRQQSDEAKTELVSIQKQHPWVKSFNNLVKTREGHVRQIANELTALRTYESTVKRTIDEITKIEQRHNTAINYVEAFDFSDAVNLLGKDIYNKILRSNGLGIDLEIAAFSPNPICTNSIVDNDEEDTDANYRAWGLPIDSY